MSRKSHNAKGAFGRKQRKQQAGTQQAGSFVIPDDVKADIAMLVRSVEWNVPSIKAGVCTEVGMVTSGKCSFRTATGYKVLHELGIPVLPVIGGMVFRAGPVEDEDVIAFCDADNYGCIINNNFLGHSWLTLGHEIIDFSVGDWREIGSHGPPIQWTAPLPEFFWADNEIVYENRWKMSRFSAGSVMETGVVPHLR
jgi:hypothetical protein